jgi:hypothetical protein
MFQWREKGRPTPLPGGRGTSRDLYRFLNLAASDAPGAYANSFRLSFHESPNSLKIRPEEAFRDTMGMADLIPDNLFLSAYKTRCCHLSNLPVSL